MKVQHTIKQSFELNTSIILRLSNNKFSESKGAMFKKSRKNITEKVFNQTHLYLSLPLDFAPHKIQDTVEWNPMVGKRGAAKEASYKALSFFVPQYHSRASMKENWKTFYI